MAGMPFSFLPPEVFSPDLKQEEQALRDLFVEEYFKDFDPILACIRVGFNVAFAREFAQILMLEPYVQRKIQEAMRKPDENPEEEKKRDFALIKNGLREAGMSGPKMNRVAAWKTLAQVQGLDKPVGPAEDDNLVEQFRDFAQVVPV